MLSSELTTSLSGAAAVITEPAATQAYRRDQCPFVDAGTPAVVVRPAEVADVIATIKVASRHRLPVVPRGAGSGLAGGANAIDGCILLDLGAMSRILEIDPVARTATVEPGALNGDLDRAARSEGLWYPPDPGSREISSIGGNIATNAGGMCCAKYGVTADHVQQLTVVLATGEVIRTGSLTRKNAAGLDLTRLLVGSEGTLGVIVEATVRLRPWPRGHATVAATFPSVSAAIATVTLLGEVEPMALELMDQTTIRAVNAMTRMGLDEDAGALVLGQFAGGDATESADVFRKVAVEHGAETFQTDDPDEGIALMAARRAAYPALERLGTTLLDDVGVPVHHLPALLERIQGAAERHAVRVGTFGHAADGNLHPTLVFDAGEPEQEARARAAFVDIADAALDLGGTVTGEHGIGALKLTHLEKQVGTVEVALMRRIKNAFDPLGILNPGRAL
jgi:glycolate oxidase subunit GlcD